MVNGKYVFNASELGKAHQHCQNEVAANMYKGKEIIYVANTFTTEKEMKPYFDLAEKYGYTTFTIIIENRHQGKNVHNVPAETLEKMKDRFNVKL